MVGYRIQEERFVVVPAASNRDLDLDRQVAASFEGFSATDSEVSQKLVTVYKLYYIDML